MDVSLGLSQTYSPCQVIKVAKAWLGACVAHGLLDGADLVTRQATSTGLPAGCEDSGNFKALADAQRGS
jgi:hypothetical protein